MSDKLYLIRDRETGLFLRYFLGDNTGWATKDLATPLNFKQAFECIVRLEKTTHCCHVVPEDWHPAIENPSWLRRAWHAILSAVGFETPHDSGRTSNQQNPERSQQSD